MISLYRGLLLVQAGKYIIASILMTSCIHEVMWSRNCAIACRVANNEYHSSTLIGMAVPYVSRPVARGSRGF